MAEMRLALLLDGPCIMGVLAAGTGAGAEAKLPNKSLLSMAGLGAANDEVLVVAGLLLVVVKLANGSRLAVCWAAGAGALEKSPKLSCAEVVAGV